MKNLFDDEAAEEDVVSLLEEIRDTQAESLDVLKEIAALLAAEEGDDDDD